MEKLIQMISALLVANACIASAGEAKKETVCSCCLDREPVGWITGSGKDADNVDIFGRQELGIGLDG